jgi:hypothetical protein
VDGPDAGSGLGEAAGVAAAGRADPGSKGQDVSTLPSVDESFDRLHRAGWSVGEFAAATAWIVSGRNGENLLEARGGTQAVAWWRAGQQARAVGMLARASGDTESTFLEESSR